MIFALAMPTVLAQITQEQFGTLVKFFGVPGAMMIVFGVMWWREWFISAKTVERIINGHIEEKRLIREGFDAKIKALENIVLERATQIVEFKLEIKARLDEMKKDYEARLDEIKTEYDARLLLSREEKNEWRVVAQKATQTAKSAVLAGGNE